MNRIANLGLIINWKSLLIVILAVISAWLSLKLGIAADFPLTMISTAIVFPIVFSIGHAYKRRESALDDYGSIKAYGRALYFASRDWIPETDADRQRHVERVRADLLNACRTMFKGSIKDVHEHEKRIYAAFSNLSGFVKRMRGDGLASGVYSRCNQYISKMIVSFESIKHIYQYRTPRTLIAFSDFFVVLLPILYGPYFAYHAIEYDITVLTFVMPTLFTIILVGLDNIQDH